ncbi:glycoside hydrolase family 28 protein [Agromyces sp. SYSU T00194]|uniref:glycoside hydrolase family 28 protein n=1 Tax=Agromyces chitinivorans TaxID=3158560 RepID=UPI0033978B30
MTDIEVETIHDPRLYGAAADGVHIDTAAIQRAIDVAAKVAGRVILAGGTYRTGALFLRSGITFEIAEDATLLATTEDDQYPNIHSRLAGIEMDGPAAVINALDCEDVTLTGAGLIDGNGQFWWDRYWGPDGDGGVRADYDSRGLRWAADYDTVRPRLIFINESRRITVSGLHIRKSPFWTIHLCYTTDATIADITIADSFGPSTDGIDIDSCERVLVERCSIACGDDNIVLKSGRDADGRRVNRPCRDIDIRDCTIGEGLGVALGSDLSGGISDVRISDLRFEGTDYGFRIKSSRARGGVVENISVTDLEMTDVVFPFSFALNWYPWFNQIEIPDTFTGDIPPWWHVLATPIPDDLAPTTVRGMTISRAVSRLSDDYTGESRAFELDGYPENPMTGIRLEDVEIQATNLGQIIGVREFELNDVRIAIDSARDPSDDLKHHLTHPQWRARTEVSDERHR